MEKLKLLYLSLQITVFFVFCEGQKACQILNNTSGEIVEVYNTGRYDSGSKCWFIKVPKWSYVTLNVTSIDFKGLDCLSFYMDISVNDKNEVKKFCSQMAALESITAWSDTKITFVYQQNHYSSQQISFRITFSRGGVFPYVPGITESQDAAITGLINHRKSSFGWEKNTHRAITALYLSGNTSFQNDSKEEILMAKQLELQAVVSLLRNSTDPISLHDLSMFINALTVTCHNPRNFYGYDLIEILAEIMDYDERLLNPSAYLTLCNANWSHPFHQTKKLFDFLKKRSKYPFHSDMEAMTIMALACAAKNKTKSFDMFYDGERTYIAAINRLIASQLSDGSFGNFYTTAVVTQALLASGQENNTSWKWNKTMEYLIQELNSTTDFLSTSLVLPIFNRKSLLDVGKVNCTKQRKHGEDEEIADIMNKLGGKIRIKYSLHIGDRSDIIHTLYLRVPEKSTVLDVLRVAQVADHKYRFLHRLVSKKVYVYEIAGKTNDPEAQKYWIPYIKNSRDFKSIQQISRSLDKQMVEDGDELTFWYRTVQDGENDVYPNKYTKPPIFSTLYPSTSDPSYFSSHHPYSRDPWRTSENFWTFRPQTGYFSTDQTQTGFWTGRPNTGYPWTGRPYTGYSWTGRPNTGYSWTGRPNTGYPFTGRPNTGYPSSPDTGIHTGGYIWTKEPKAGKPKTGATEYDYASTNK